MNLFLSTILLNQGMGMLGRCRSLWVLIALGLFTFTTAEAASVTVSNANSGDNGGYRFFNESGGDIADPPGRIFIGGFSSAYDMEGSIGAEFNTDFNALVADFIPIGSVAIEEDGPIGATGLHISTDDYTVLPSVVGRKVAIWVTTAGTIDSPDGEHLIYVLNATAAQQLFVAEGGPGLISYEILLRPDTDGGNGDLEVGSFGIFDDDLGFGAGTEFGFNTVAIPEPSSIFSLVGVGILGLVFGWRRRIRYTGVESESN